MPEGNFAATLALRQHGTPPGLSRIGFVAGLALHDALTAVAGGPFALKWPNDVLLEGGKLAGVLLERERVAERAGSEAGGGPGSGAGARGSAGSAEPYTLAIGFGVNLAAAPAEVAPSALPAVSLGGAVAPEALLDALIPAFASREAQAAAGFETIRRDWLARAARLGETITARTLREARTGVFETIDGDGHLVLRTSHGRERIASADVFFGPEAA
jgi:BirA family biotin operon repressor/biotin-[acetyl-CoA-carboxylase] ligase